VEFVSYRIAVGPQQGHKVFTLHAGVATRANEREKLERMCQYITKPAVSTKRLSLTGLCPRTCASR